MEALVSSCLRRNINRWNKNEKLTDSSTYQRVAMDGNGVELYSRDDNGTIGLFEGIHKFLEEYIIWQYFGGEKNVKSFITSSYNFNGSLQEDGNVLWFNLEQPKNEDDKMRLDFAMQCINRQNIYDSVGRLLILREK